MSLQPEWVLSVIVVAVLLVGGMEWIKRLVRREVEREWERRSDAAHASPHLQEGDATAGTAEQNGLSDPETEADASSEAEPEKPPPGNTEASFPPGGEGTPFGKTGAALSWSKLWESDRSGPACYPKLWKALKSAQTQIWRLYEPRSERSGEIDLTLPGGWKGMKGIPIRPTRKSETEADNEQPVEKFRQIMWRLRRSLAHSQWRTARDLLTAHELDCSEEVFKEASQVIRDLRRVLAMATEDADAPRPRLLRNEVYGKLQALKRRLQAELGRPLDDGPEPDDLGRWLNPGR